ncbi:MAG: sugar phosphate isomerase/epimerase family protein [Pirellulaceae bacterium]|nr:sugar phosphate isomerase/epimerase family protein [Pirellulaceae bacterium]
MQPNSASQVETQNQGAPNYSRRSFMASTAALALASTATSRLQAAEISHTTKPRRLLKTLKVGMVKVPGDLTAKFAAVKAAGYEGIELDSPGIDVEETKKAIAATGLVVDGSVCSTHWNIRHTSPDAAVRAKALEDLKTAIIQTQAVGGHTVLLVVGKGEDGPESEIWPRSVENIKQALPLAAELGMTIAIENVWNQFLYEHNGPNNQTADKFVKYVDEFKSPWVGMQFDIGNHWKYGNPAEWIRTLGHRVVKLDIKGFARTGDKWADITKDDIPWADVRKALDDIGFYGWVAAEVGGGDAERLKTVAQQIDAALNIG